MYACMCHPRTIMCANVIWVVAEYKDHGVLILYC